MTISSKQCESITILSANDKRRCSKTFEGVNVKSYPDVLIWNVHTRPAASLEQLHTTLTKAAAFGRAIAISGALIEGKPDTDVFRRYKGEKAFFEEVSRCWVAIDVDGFACPHAELTPQKKAEWAARMMPAPFGKAGCVYQYTSSAFTKGDDLYLRFWYLLDEAVLPSRWRGFFRMHQEAYRTDPALYNPVQPHYIAAPVFVDCPDPLKDEERWGIIEGERVRVGSSIDDLPVYDDEAIHEAREDACRVQIEHYKETKMQEEVHGSRHHEAANVAGELVGLGASDEEIVEFLDGFIKHHGREPQDNEARNLLQFAHKKVAAGEFKTRVKPASQHWDDDESSEFKTDDEIPKEELFANYRKKSDAAFNARCFEQRNYPDADFVHWAGADFEWDGEKWRELETADTIVHRVINDSQFPENKSRQIAKTFRGFMSRERLRWPCWLDDPKKDAVDVIVLRNGMVRVSDVLFGGIDLQAADKTFFNRTVLPFNYVPDADCPTWHKFLDDCFPDEDDQKRECQKMFGYLLTNSNAFQKIFVLRGAPRSGKGTMMNVLKGMIGPENVGTPPLNGLDGRFALEPLYDKPLIIIPEANEQDSRKVTGAMVDMLKGVSGGDAFDIERKGLPFLSNIQLPGRFVMQCNRFPNFKDPSGALLRRLHVLVFKQSFIGKEDEKLTSKLLKELPGIFNWALKGLYVLQRDDGGFKMTKSMKKELAIIKDITQPVASCLDEIIKRDKKGFVSYADLYEKAYKGWCDETGSYPTKRYNFVQEVMAIYPAEKARHYVNGERCRGLSGISLTEEGMRLCGMPVVADDEDNIDNWY